MKQKQFKHNLSKAKRQSEHERETLNNIFSGYSRIQQKVKAIRSSVNILIEHGFTIVDLEGKILRKNEIGEIE